MVYDVNTSVFIPPSLTIKAENDEGRVLKFLELGKHFFLLLCLRKHLKYLSPAEAD